MTTIPARSQLVATLGRSLLMILVELVVFSLAVLELENQTYATPTCWLWPRIKQHFPNDHLYRTAIP